MLNLGSSRESGDEPTVDLAMLSSSGFAVLQPRSLRFVSVLPPAPFQTQTRKTSNKHFKQTKNSILGFSEVTLWNNYSILISFGTLSLL